jgi:hypothetical protein
LYSPTAKFKQYANFQHITQGDNLSDMVAE